VSHPDHRHLENQSGVFGDGVAYVDFQQERSTPRRAAPVGAEGFHSAAAGIWMSRTRKIETGHPLKCSLLIPVKANFYSSCAKRGIRGSANGRRFELLLDICIRIDTMS
jgi:hypothetical protein